MADDDLTNPYRRRLTAPWPFLYTVVQDCGLVMNVSTEPQIPTAAAAVSAKPVKSFTDEVPRKPLRPAPVSPPVAVLNWVAPRTTPTTIEAQLDAMDASDGDRSEMLKFAAFLNDSTSMKLPELIERHGAEYLGFTEAELVSLHRPAADNT